jgi:hypothetical protein
MYHRLVQRVG